MVGRPPSRDYVSAFGQALAAELNRRPTNQAELARDLGVSASYLNQVMSGRKTASPALADRTAQALGLDEEQRTQLHHAAAVSAGYALDLSKRKLPGD